MPTFRYTHPTEDSDGRPMGASFVDLTIKGPGGDVVKESTATNSEAAGTQVTRFVPMDAIEAAAATGGTAEATVRAPGLESSDPSVQPAPAEGVEATQAGQVTNFTYSND